MDKYHPTLTTLETVDQSTFCSPLESIYGQLETVDQSAFLFTSRVYGQVSSHSHNIGTQNLRPQFFNNEFQEQGTLIQ
jgi:hypothetical protein